MKGTLRICDHQKHDIKDILNKVADAHHDKKIFTGPVLHDLYKQLQKNRESFPVIKKTLGDTKKILLDLADRVEDMYGPINEIENHFHQFELNLDAT